MIKIYRSICCDARNVGDLHRNKIGWFGQCGKCLNESEFELVSPQPDTTPEQDREQVEGSRADAWRDSEV